MRFDNNRKSLSFNYRIKVPTCTREQLKCVGEIPMDSSNCLQKCSGMLVTSYTQHDIENQELPKLVSMFAAYFGQKMNTFEDMEEAFQGMVFSF